MGTTERSGEPAGKQVPIDVELVYATPEAVWRCALRLAEPGSVADALVTSPFFAQFPEYSLDTVQVGVYGQQCSLDRELMHNDRIEIYRPLIFDPMESRRRRAQHRQRTRR